LASSLALRARIRAAEAQPFVSPADSLNDKVFNALLRARVAGIGFENDVADRVATALLDAKRGLLAQIRAIRDSGGEDLTPGLRASLLDAVNRALAVALNGASATIQAGAEVLGREQARLVNGAVFNAVRAVASPKDLAAGVLARPEPATLAALGNVKALGRGLDRWRAKFSFDVTDKADALLARLQGEGAGVAAAERALADLFGDLGPDLETLARTALAERSAQVTEDFFDQNTDLIAKVQYVATLDDRTCPICAPDDGEVFPEDGDRPRLPRHLNCRCVYVPVFDDFPLVGEKRASGSPGRPDVPSRVTFDSWVSKQPAGVQKEVLGATRYSLWKKGLLDLGDFVSHGSILSLADLKSRFGGAVRDLIASLGY